MCCVRGKLPSEVDLQFLHIASQLATYGLNAYTVTVSFSNLCSVKQTWVNEMTVIVQV